MTLDIIVSSPMPWAGTNFEGNEEIIQKAINDGHKPCIMSYLHGEVEDKMGYDITLCLNGEEIVDFEKEQYKEGVYDAKVKGYDNPCKAYLWNANNSARALIVDATNKEDVEFANQKFAKREYFI